MSLPTRTLPYAGGVVEYAVADSGAGDGAGEGPVTLFLHGLAGSIEDVRPLASGVRGRKVFAHLPGHGRSTGPDPLGYPALAAAARAVADHDVSDGSTRSGYATRALGVSLGAATLLRILSETPDRFERVVLYLPAVADIPRAPEAVAPHRELAERLEAQDADGVKAALLRTQPTAVRATLIAREWAERRAKELIADGGDPRRWLPLACAVPLASLASLAAVTAPVLVIAQEGDPAHPVEAARRVAGALPNARLEVFGPEGALWGNRRALRELVAPALR